MKDEKFVEKEKLSTICFWLIKQCESTNADTLRTMLFNVTNNKGKNIGDWEIIVRKMTKKGEK